MVAITMVRIEFLRPSMAEKDVFEDMLLAVQPINRTVTIEQVAALVLYLCSDQASAITGTILPVDGGWTAQ